MSKNKKIKIKKLINNNKLFNNAQIISNVIFKMCKMKYQIQNNKL